MRVEQIVVALRDLGVAVELSNTPISGSFLPGVWLENSAVVVCPWAAQPGDLLHEAGHWAITPSQFRPLYHRGSVTARPVLATLEAFLYSPQVLVAGPNNPLVRAVLNMGDCEAQAWAFAAAYRIGFDPKLAFCFEYPGVPRERQPYQGDGDAVWNELILGEHAGVRGLEAAGMCCANDWPSMERWVQP